MYLLPSDRLNSTIRVTIDCIRVCLLIPKCLIYQPHSAACLSTFQDSREISRLEFHIGISQWDYKIQWVHISRGQRCTTLRSINRIKWPQWMQWLWTRRGGVMNLGKWGPSQKRYCMLRLWKVVFRYSCQAFENIQRSLCDDDSVLQYLLSFSEKADPFFRRLVLPWDSLLRFPWRLRRVVGRKN